ncbi:MAG: hypothetical protein ACRD20_14635 [Terriglobales bacterium]
MFDVLVRGLAHLMSWLFIIGMAGCIFVIPITAYQLFNVLFEKDKPDEINPDGHPVI